MARPIDKTVKWFPHEYTMRLDIKIRRLRAKFGWDKGYSLYNMVLEELCNSDYVETPFTGESREETIDLWADSFGCPRDLLANFMDESIKIGAFVINERGNLTSEGLKKRMSKLFSKRIYNAERLSNTRANENLDFRLDDEKVESNKAPLGDGVQPYEPSKSKNSYEKMPWLEEKNIVKVEKTGGNLERLILKGGDIVFRVNGTEYITAQSMVRAFLQRFEKVLKVKPAPSWDGACKRLLQEFTPDELLGVFDAIVENEFFRKAIQSPVKLLNTRKSDGVRWIDVIRNETNGKSNKFSGERFDNKPQPKPTVLVIPYKGNYLRVSIATLKKEMEKASSDFKNAVVDRLREYYSEKEIQSMLN
ncbi:MAG: hypothetical protein AMQ22_00221 [Candidatus Methanofastidiosum methylothiophilum]|uniref:Lin1244/Lin1753-like N-terminal domain-containing protein n=1 Tax=Candidatus Methanofastidiosum methylothiophilum TaxID=1705564 RepID=A0A150IS82_9EURY|nr:MAG: hypothetical protein APG11_00822 [Candidatus Methanofastidiosum methylthiophilus]KYC53550.1 MAG: hypothetical protein AMQ22_00221 [Candidatus Methanofastidiosum methylthiophilus]